MDAQVLQLVLDAMDRFAPFPHRQRAAHILYIRSLVIASELLSLKGEALHVARSALLTALKHALPQLSDYLEKGGQEGMVGCVEKAWREGSEEERLFNTATLAVLLQTVYEISIQSRAPQPRPWV